MVVPMRPTRRTFTRLTAVAAAAFGLGEWEDNGPAQPVASRAERSTVDQTRTAPECIQPKIQHSVRNGQA